MSAITDAAQALAGLLRAAEEGGLPLPFTAQAEEWAPHRHPLTDNAHGGTTLQVHTLADLSDWATWLDAPIDDSAEVHEDNVHCHVFGMAGPVPVRVTALVPLAAEVAPSSSSSYYTCERCDAQFGIGGTFTGSDDDLAAEESFRSDVEFHESGQCIPAAVTQ